MYAREAEDRHFDGRSLYSNTVGVARVNQALFFFRSLSCTGTNLQKQTQKKEAMSLDSPKYTERSKLKRKITAS